jgi:hypothetical protein
MKRPLILLALVFFATSVFAADDRSGVWSARVDGDKLYVNLVQPPRDGNRGQNNIGTNLSFAALTGLTKSDIDADAANVTFSFAAPAGTIAFEGRFSKGLGAGNYRFTPNDAFLREMESLGYSGGFSDERLLIYALHDFRPQSIRELRALGYTIEKRQIDEMAIFRIDANFVKELAALGYPNPTFRELVDMRVGRVDAAFVKGMRDAGYGDISAREMAQLGILGVTPAYVRELKGAGLTSLTPKEATDLKIGRITAALIAEYRRLGYDLTPHQLSEFGIFHVTPQFIEEQRARGEKDLTPRRLIDMKIFSREARRR